MSTKSNLTVDELSFSRVAISAKTTWIFVSVTLSDGTKGFGEATDFANAAAIESTLALLAQVVASERPAPIAPALSLLAGKHVSIARKTVSAAFEQAILDAMARRCDIPLAVMLGGAYRQQVPTYANINRGIPDRSPEGFAAQARAVIADEGYGALKIAPFDGFSWDSAPDRAALDTGLARIGAVRDAVGPDVRLLIDCHSRLNPATAALVIRETAPLSPFWIEDPVDATRFSARDQRQLRSLGQQQGIRLAGGESLETLGDTRRLLDDGAFDVILPDLRLTGVRNGMAILELATSCGVEASLHNPVGPILDAVSRHVAAALPSFLILERQVRESPLYTEIAGGRLEIENGKVGLGQGPGSGLNVDTNAMQRAASAAQPQVLSFAGIPGAGPDA
ncbi:mandelate racemase/muconate lactonizing enzyme family protein [Oceaniglobus trochenteri]|uniref:mandelate racemase/muconate lactonizing enzyme family protein n=1 Tax=Oceaniglobus trochenteri TaxID=2763260 RepID=UPI001D0005F2|nr:mandelate racemase/muconate lactonizing enzyme family protein [Oceaniglobus trochenteri]